MKQRVILALIAFLLAFSYPVSFAALPASNTSEEEKDQSLDGDEAETETSEDTDGSRTNAKNDKSTDGEEDAPTYIAAQEKPKIDMSQIPKGADPELVQKYFDKYGKMPTNYTGLEGNPGRAYLAVDLGIPGERIQAMEKWIAYLQKNPNAWKNGCTTESDGMCLDAVNTAYYKLFEQNPMWYADGNVSPGVNKTLQTYINSNTYALADTSRRPPTMQDIGGTSSSVIPGTIAIGGTTNASQPGSNDYKYHIAMAWTLPDGRDTWVAQTASNANFTDLINTKYEAAVYPIAATPDGAITNPNAFPVIRNYTNPKNPIRLAWRPNGGLPRWAAAKL